MGMDQELKGRGQNRPLQVINIKVLGYATHNWGIFFWYDRAIRVANGGAYFPTVGGLFCYRAAPLNWTVSP